MLLVGSLECWVNLDFFLNVLLMHNWLKQGQLCPYKYRISLTTILKNHKHKELLTFG